MIELIDVLNKRKKEKENRSVALNILGLPLYAKVPDVKVRRHMQRYLAQSQQKQEKNEQ